MQRCLDEVKRTNLGNITELKNILKNQVGKFIEKDTTRWNQYCRKPSVYINAPESIFFESNEQVMEAELDFILKQRNQEGVWDISWSWGAYDKEFVISENWWKAIKSIEYMLLLKRFKRL